MYAQDDVELNQNLNMDFTYLDSRGNKNDCKNCQKRFIPRYFSFMSFVDRWMIIQLDRLTLRPKPSLKSLKAQHSWAAWCNQSIKITWHCWRLPIWPLVMTGHYNITIVLIVHFILRIHQLESGKGEEDIQIHEHARSTTSKTKMQEFRIVIEIWRPLLLLRQHLWALYKETPSTRCNTHNFKQATIMLGVLYPIFATITQHCHCCCQVQNWNGAQLRHLIESSILHFLRIPVLSGCVHAFRTLNWGICSLSGIILTLDHVVSLLTCVTFTIEKPKIMDCTNLKGTIY